MRIAILGAAGPVGRALGDELAAAGEPFRVVGRSADKLRHDFSHHGELAEICVTDLSDPEAARAAVRGAETLFYAVGVPYWRFELHPKLTRVTLDAAVAEGVRQFVHVSTVYPYGRPRTPRVDESHPREPHTFNGRMRKEQEDLVLAADDPAAIRTVILRPPDFYGPGVEQSFVASIFDAAIKGGKANVIGPLDAPHEFIFVPDLARTLLAVSREPAAFGRAWNVAGAGR